MSMRAEARAEVARARPLHRDERVEPAHVGQDGEPCVAVRSSAARTRSNSLLGMILEVSHRARG